MNEEWMSVPVDGFGSYYSISSLGRIRRDRAGDGTWAGRIRRPIRNCRSGYYYIMLSAPGVKLKNVAVHRLVAIAFLGAPPTGHEVNHRDGDKANNALANLEYVTPSQNGLHAYRVLGKKPRPGRQKLSEAQAIEAIRLWRAGGLNQTEIAQKFGVRPNTINGLVHGITWKHLSLPGAQIGRN